VILPVFPVRLFNGPATHYPMVGASDGLSESGEFSGISRVSFRPRATSHNRGSIALAITRREARGQRSRSLLLFPKGPFGKASGAVPLEPFSAQLAEPAPVVRLHSFLRESSLIVIPKDVHELEDDPVAVRRKRANR
jgi:hypothetical protein